MDTTEDLSARVLLRNILITEPPRTPVTRSTQAQSANETQRITRSTRRSAGSQTPQDILRRSLRTKMRESISRKSLPPPTRRTGSSVLRRANTPAPPSVLFDEGDTPRHILMNILRTEPVKSPVVHETVVPQEPQPPASTNSSIVGMSLTSVDGSRLDLSDITFGHAISTAKGLRRKRPRRSLNVTDFEKRLKDGDDNGVEESLDDHSSLSLSSSSSLSLKTPFVDVRTEKRGLQRRVSNRRKITEADFGAAVNKRQTGVVSGLEAVRQNNTTFLEGFTLGQSKLGELEITSDIINSNTALYDQPESTASNFSTVPPQDKSTEWFDDDVEEAASESKEASGAAECTDDEAAPQSQDEEDEVAETQSSDAVKSEEEGSNVESHTEEEAATASQSEEEEATAPSQSEEEEAAAPSQSEEEDAAAPSQSEEEEAATASQSEEEQAAAPSQSEEEEAAAASQSEEEEAATASQSEEEEEAAAPSQSQSEEEEAATASQSEEEEAAAPSQSEEDEAAAASQSEEEEAASQSEEEEVTAESKAEGSVVSQSEFEEIDECPSDSSSKPQPEEANGTITSQTEDENDGRSEEEDDEREPKHLVRDDEHISRRSRRSEGGLIMPVTETDGYLPDDKEAGWLEGLEKGAGESSPPGMRIPDSESGEGEPDFDKENSFRLEMTYDIQDSSRKSDDPHTGAAAAEPAKQEEDSEEDDEDSEDGEEIPMKTPAFVKKKRNLLRELNSPSAFKGRPDSSSTSAGLPPTKPKQVRKRKAGPTKKAAGLPKSYLMGAFKHFAKTKVSADVYPVLSEIMDKFFERMADDLETYAVHAKRKTIEIEDAVLLLKRQGYVNDKMPVEVLIEKFLRMDQRKLLIPVATSGNVVVPKSKR